jgi:hypothetical protein
MQKETDQFRLQRQVLAEFGPNALSAGLEQATFGRLVRGRTPFPLDLHALIQSAPLFSGHFEREYPNKRDEMALPCSYSWNQKGRHLGSSFLRLANKRVLSLPCNTPWHLGSGGCLAPRWAASLTQRHDSASLRSSKEKRLWEGLFQGQGIPSHRPFS